MLHIYMNEHIKEKEPKDPVICVFDPKTKRMVYTDKLELMGYDGEIIGRIHFQPKGVKNAPHQVRVSVEIFNNENVRLLDG